MYVIDEITGDKIPQNKSTLVVVKHLQNTIIFGYVNNAEPLIRFKALVNNNFSTFIGSETLLRDTLVFSNLRGYYISPIGISPSELVREMYQLGQGNFPYSLERRYEAIESFNMFEGKQKILNIKNFQFSKYIKYSFGLEFETSMGYVPEDICFRDGLIPLRDGSISGIEYSTVVLKGDEGLSLLYQQIETLRKHTAFNKECALHIHFGGFALEKNTIYRIYLACKKLEDELELLVPNYTFYTAKYKDNGKDYCKKLPIFQDFETLYKYLVGELFYGSFTQAHPNDIERKAKWRIPTRRK